MISPFEQMTEKEMRELKDSASMGKRKEERQRGKTIERHNGWGEGEREDGRGAGRDKKEDREAVGGGGEKSRVEKGEAGKEEG